MCGTEVPRAVMCAKCLVFIYISVHVFRAVFFCGTVLGSPPLDVIQHPTLWSSDFPHQAKA